MYLLQREATRDPRKDSIAIHLGEPLFVGALRVLWVKGWVKGYFQELDDCIPENLPLHG